MKASEAQLGAALDSARTDVRLYLLYGPDEAAAGDYAARLLRALGDGAERIELDPATLRGDPGRLADEARSLGLFGGRRLVMASGVGEESAAAVELLLSGRSSEHPVLLIAPGIRASGKLAKAVLAAPDAMAAALYLPEGRAAEHIAAGLAREQGLNATPGAARRLASAASGDRAVMRREAEKLALYLDASPEQPRELTEAALDAIGADLDEGDMGEVIAALVAARPDVLGTVLARFAESGGSAIALLRQTVRRLMTLADMRSEIDRGSSVDATVKRHRIFWKEEAATAAALRQWSASDLAAAIDRVRAAERAQMSGTADPVFAESALIGLAQRRRR